MRVDEKATRRPYEPPRLVDYGDIREITRTNVTNNMNDPVQGSSNLKT